MITVTNRTILDYLVRKIIKEKRATPKYIQIDNNSLKIIWHNGKVTTRNIFSRMSIDSRLIIISLADYRGDEIARITYTLGCVVKKPYRYV